MKAKEIIDRGNRIHRLEITKMSIEAAKKVCLRESAGGTVGWKLEGLSKRPDWLKPSFLVYLVRFQRRHALTVPNVPQMMLVLRPIRTAVYPPTTYRQSSSLSLVRSSLTTPFAA